MNKAELPTPLSATSETQRQVQLYAISHELNSLVGQNPTKVLRCLFTALVTSTNVESGHLFVFNKEGNPEFCLLLRAGQLNEYEGHQASRHYKPGLTEWVYRQHRGVLVTNTVTDPRWPAWATSFEEPAGSALAVPILAASQPIGAIALTAVLPDHFSETDLSIITNLADQTGVIIENVRLNTLTAQKLNLIQALHQTAHTINASLDLEQTLYTILDHLNQTIAYQGAAILLQADEGLQPATVTGFEQTSTSLPTILTPTNASAFFRALHQGRVIGVGAEEKPIELEPLTLVKPIRSCATAPLTARGENLGLIILASHKSRAYSDQDLVTLNAFADHIAIAVANHRLEQKTDRRLRELAFLVKAGQAISSTLNLDRILHLLLEQVRDLLGIDASSIALRDEQTGELVFEVASGEGAVGVLGIRLQPGQGIAGWVAETGKPLLVQDVYKDSRFFPDIDKKTGMTTQAILCVPIVLKGRVVGIIEALNPTQVSFDEQAVELLNALAGLAATAISNARLFARVHSAEDRYEKLFKDSVNPIIITDLKGHIVDVNHNACLLLGQDQESLRGVNITHFRSADGRLDFASYHNQILSSQEAVFQTAILSNGQRTTVEITCKRILLKGTSLIQWIGRDISAEIELEQTREDLIHMIVHDLRNPLGNIMNSLDVLYDVIDEQDDSVSRTELLNIAQRSGKRLQNLINSILDINWLETGQAMPKTRATDPAPLLRDAVEFVSPQAEVGEIGLSARFAETLPQVEIDSDMILRVVLNLLDNAIKFTQVGGTVKLTAKVIDSVIEVAVADNGPGIPAGQIKTIFDKFTRVRRENGPKGTGLGLTFCRLAVKAHGGHIWVESKLGQGATFRFTLPICAEKKENGAP